MNLKRTSLISSISPSFWCVLTSIVSSAASISVDALSCTCSNSFMLSSCLCINRCCSRSSATVDDRALICCCKLEMSLETLVSFERRLKKLPAADSSSTEHSHSIVSSTHCVVDALIYHCHEYARQEERHTLWSCNKTNQMFFNVWVPNECRNTLCAVQSSHWAKVVVCARPRMYQVQEATDDSLLDQFLDNGSQLARRCKNHTRFAHCEQHMCVDCRGCTNLQVRPQIFLVRTGCIGGCVSGNLFRTNIRACSTSCLVDTTHTGHLGLVGIV